MAIRERPGGQRGDATRRGRGQPRTSVRGQRGGEYVVIVKALLDHAPLRVIHRAIAVQAALFPLSDADPSVPAIDHGIAAQLVGDKLTDALAIDSRFRAGKDAQAVSEAIVAGAAGIAVAIGVRNDRHATRLLS